jgi:hypothetical protein
MQKNNKFYICFYAKNITLLYKIKNILKCGQIVKCKKYYKIKKGLYVVRNKNFIILEYFKYIITKTVDLLYIINIINGNLQLKKSNMNFIKWLKFYNIDTKRGIMLKQFNRGPSLLQKNNFKTSKRFYKHQKNLEPN